MTDDTHITLSDLHDDPDRTYQLDRQHVFHSWSAQASLQPMVVTGAEGSYVWDGAGNRLLDFTSQLVFTNLGHRHPAVVQGIKGQLDRLPTAAPGTATAARSRAAQLVAQHAPEGLDTVFFTNGGADANEHAIRMARLHTGRPKVLSRYRSYHGGTQTAINVTGDQRRWRNDSGNAGVVHFFGPFLYRSEWGASTEEEECDRALQHLSQVIRFEGPDTIAAIILETVPGTAGVMVPPEGYLAGVRELCDRHGILLICDEVMAGFGRCGEWLALDRWDLRPDLVTMAKGINSGVVPLGAVAISESVAQTFADTPYPGGLTYSGHVLACAAAVANIEAMQAEGVIEHVRRIDAEVLRPGLADLAERHPMIGEVRGLGVFWALEMVKDRQTREPLAEYPGSSPQMAAIVAACKDRGLLPMANVNRVHLVPPCTVSEDEARAALEALDAALGSLE